jgi:hypothetical protein
MTTPKSILKKISQAVSIIWYLEIIAGITFISAFLASATIRKQFVLMLPIDFTQLNLRKIESLNSNFGNARLDGYSGTLVFHIESSWGNIASMTGVYLILIGILIFITYHARQIFKNFENNQHFINNNIIHLRVIAGIITIIPIVQVVLMLVANHIIENNLKLGPFLNLSTSFNYGLFIAGIVLLSVIEIFQLGIELEEEQKLTV